MSMHIVPQIAHYYKLLIIEDFDKKTVLVVI